MSAPAQLANDTSIDIDSIGGSGRRRRMNENLKIPPRLPRNLEYTTGKFGGDVQSRDPSQPATPRRGPRTLAGLVKPPLLPEVRSGRSRIEQLSSPRYRVTGSDYQAPTVGFGNASKIMTRDEHVAFDAGEKAQRRIAQHPSGDSARGAAEQQRAIGRGITLPPSEKLPSAVELLTALQHNIGSSAEQCAGSRLASTSAHQASGMAGLMLARSSNRDDAAALRGTKKQQVLELTNTQVPLADLDFDSVPARAITSGRRSGAEDAASRSGNAPPPPPAAVRSLAVSGIDASRTERPQAPSYFHSDAVVIQRTTRHGASHHPHTMGLSQPDPRSGHYVSSDAQFDPHTRGMHNASSYVLADKLRAKAAQEIRISKRGNNEDAVVQRAHEEIARKRAKSDKRVEAKKARIADYEERVHAGF